MGGAGMLAAGNYSVFAPYSNRILTRFPHRQVLVLVCWEVCSSPTPSMTSVTTSVAETSVTFEMAMMLVMPASQTTLTYDLLGIYM